MTKRKGVSDVHMNGNQNKKQSIYLQSCRIFVLAVLMIFTMFSPAQVQAATLRMSVKSKTMYVGDTLNLKVKGTSQKAKWSSGKKAVATVTSKGKVTAKKKGTTVITAKVNGKKLTCKITVKERAVTSVTLPIDNLDLNVNQTYALTANVIPSNATNKKITWSTSDASVVSVTEDGFLQAKAVGKATIKAQSGKWSAACQVYVSSDKLGVYDTQENLLIEAAGQYVNWDGVSNVEQFTDQDGNACFAYDKDNTVHILKLKNGLLQTAVTIAKPHSRFGGVACDRLGNYYLVTGEINKGTDTNTETIFISKYDVNGKHIQTVGDNGSSSVADYYPSEFYTQAPFLCGNCDVKINGNLLAVHYARQMYSGHQSNSVFAINIQTMQKENLGDIYQSHSFAQRTIPYKNGFLFAGEGDCYGRAFTIFNTIYKDDYDKCQANLFDFWVRKNALSDWDMWALNNNFAHMGGLAYLDDTHVAFVGTSVKSLNENAQKETEQVYVQVFDPNGDLTSASGYYTNGERSGLAGSDGDVSATNYGVKWLTNEPDTITISNPQVVSAGGNKIIILYEKYQNTEYLKKYKGLYSVVLDKSGNVLEQEKCISTNYKLNPCRMPIYANGYVLWACNKECEDEDEQTGEKKMYICSMILEKE